MTLVTVELEGNATWSRDRNIGHYGGALDKENSATEGKIPYAWVFYRELRAARGSAYATVFEGTKTGLVHSEILAIARSECARWRAADKVRNNSLPLTSDEKLESWVKRLGVMVRPSDTRHDIRKRCAAKYRGAIGPTYRALDDACRELLGPIYVRTWTIEGTDLATPPTPTHWPGVNPGPATHDLGGGSWFSSRCHFIVEVQQPPEMLEADFLNIINVDLFELLDRMLPSWASFDWGTDLSTGGFTLDVSKLDYGALG